MLLCLREKRIGRRMVKALCQIPTYFGRGLNLTKSFSHSPAASLSSERKQLLAERRGERRPFSKTRPFVFLLAGIILTSIIGTSLYTGNGSSTSQFPTAPGSWNPKVPCASPRIVRITDVTNNQTGSGSMINSLFSAGITYPVDNAKRRLRPGHNPHCSGPRGQHYAT